MSSSSSTSSAVGWRHLVRPERGYPVVSSPWRPSWPTVPVSPHFRERAVARRSVPELLHERRPLTFAAPVATAMIERFEPGRSRCCRRRDHQGLRRGHRRRRRWRICARPAPATSSGGSPRRLHAEQPPAIGGTSVAATSRTTTTTRWWSTGGRRSPRRSTAPRCVDAARPRAPPPLHARRGRPHRLPRRAPRRPDRTPASPPASPTRCSPRSVRHAPVRCARSSPPSRPSRTSSSAPLRAVPRRAGRARHRQDRGGPAPPPTCCSSTVAAWSATASSWSGRTGVFLDYIGNVLPSLGERSVRQATVLDLCVPKVEIEPRLDDDDTPRKGDAPMLDGLAASACWRSVRRPRTSRAASVRARW